MKTNTAIIVAAVLAALIVVGGLVWVEQRKESAAKQAHDEQVIAEAHKYGEEVERKLQLDAERVFIQKHGRMPTDAERQVIADQRHKEAGYDLK